MRVLDFWGDVIIFHKDGSVTKQGGSRMFIKTFICDSCGKEVKENEKYVNVRVASDKDKKTTRTLCEKDGCLSKYMKYCAAFFKK